MKSQNINTLKWDLFKNYPISTGITTRTGGHSKPPYTSLNMATHTGDILEHVQKNRELLCSSLNINPDFYTHGIQVHSDKIHIVNEKNIGNNNIECDGLLTKTKNVLLNTYIADCVPIVIYDHVKNIGGLCHCGWKGTSLKLVKKMIYQFIDTFNSYRSDILIGIGPSIGACCYNVSMDVFTKFSPKGNEGFNRGNNLFLDLKEINKNQALESGIPEKNIEVMNLCTSCNNDIFYSYRKEGESSGRFSCYMSLIS